MPRKTLVEKQAETRARLLEAATEIFLDRGYHTASLEEISERAGYSTGAVYHNFKGKEGLFVGCLKRMQKSASEMWEDFIATATDKGLEAAGFGDFLVSVLPSPSWNRALIQFRVTDLSDESRDALEVGYERMRDFMTQVLKLYCDAVGVTPAAPIEVIATSIGATVDGLRLHSLTKPDIDLAGTVLTAMNLMLGVPVSAADGATPEFRGHEGGSRDRVR
jgi:AcrR family transcriptional regulator